MKKILVLALLLALCGSVEAVQRVPAHQVSVDTSETYQVVSPALHLQDGVIEPLDAQAESNRVKSVANSATGVLQQAEIDGLQSTNLVQEADIDTNQADIAILQTNALLKANASNYVSCLMYYNRATNAHSQSDAVGSYLMTWIDDAPEVIYDPFSIWDEGGSYLLAPTNGWYSISIDTALTFDGSLLQWEIVASPTNANSRHFGGQVKYGLTATCAGNLNTLFKIPSPIGGYRIYPLHCNLLVPVIVSNIVIDQVSISLMYYGPTLPENL